MNIKRAEDFFFWKNFRGFVLVPFVLSIIFFSTLKASFAEDATTENKDEINASQSFDKALSQISAGIQSGGLASETMKNQPDMIVEVSTETAFAVLPAPLPDPAPEPEEPMEINADALKYFESQGGLLVGGTAEFRGSTVFKLVTKFMDKVLFKDKVEFSQSVSFEKGFNIEGEPTFSKNTAGFAIIKKGQQVVEIRFKKKYKSTPVVTASLSVKQYDDPEVRAAAEDLLLISDIKFVVTNVTSGGFEIKMDRVADSDIPFSWHSLAIEDPQMFDGTNGGSEENAPENSPENNQLTAPTGTEAPLVGNQGGSRGDAGRQNNQPVQEESAGNDAARAQANVLPLLPPSATAN